MHVIEECSGACQPARHSTEWQGLLQEVERCAGIRLLHMVYQAGDMLYDVDAQ